jgi:hypothetical protein
MNNSLLAYLLKYSNPNSMLVVTNRNNLIELKCPFTVKVVKSVGDFKLNEFKTVEELKVSTNLKLVFIIEKEPFFYYYFDIIL